MPPPSNATPPPAWGAKIVTFDRLAEDREAIGRKIQAETGATLIPPL